MTVYFVSDGVGNARGFQASYVATNTIADGWASIYDDGFQGGESNNRIAAAAAGGSSSSIYLI